MSLMERERAKCAPTVLLELTPSMRGLIEDAIESLVLLLDEIDGDADLEDDDPAEDDGSGEPWLGALERHPRPDHGMAVSADRSDQTRWSRSDTCDLEDEHDGREPEFDDEPSLGSLDAEVDQRNWRAGDVYDRELDDSDFESDA